MNEKENNLRDFDSAIRDIRSIRLSAEERARMKSRITMRRAAPGTGAAEVLGLPSRPRRPVKSPLGPRRLAQWAGGILAFILVVAAGTVTAAGTSLPGQALYALKTGVLEPVRGAFQGTGPALASWQAALVNTRLSEAESLAAAGKLDDAKSAEIERLLDRHTVAFHQALQSVQTQSPQQASALQTALQVSVALHAKILSQFIAYASTTVTSTAASARAAARLKAEADLHAADPMSPWSFVPPQATSTSDLILQNVKGADLQAAVASSTSAILPPFRAKQDPVAPEAQRAIDTKGRR